MIQDDDGNLSAYLDGVFKESGDGTCSFSIYTDLMVRHEFLCQSGYVAGFK